MSPKLLGHGIAFTLLLLAGLLLAGDRLVVPWAVAGRSMEPTLLPGDRLLIDRWTYRQRAPRNGELVLFEGPAGVHLVKRVSVVPERPRYFPELWGTSRAIGPGALWLLGDNPAGSRDSRQFGLVPADRVRGRVVLRYWPLVRGYAVRNSAP